MKTVILVRHAKSGWENAKSDFSRPLNARGIENAPEMAGRLAGQQIKVDCIISSPARRAEHTAQLFAEGLGIPPEKIIYLPELYNAFDETFLDTISKAPADADCILIVSHNPGLLLFVNTLTTVRVDNMPTSAVFGVRAPIQDWADFRSGKKEFLFFDFPKSQN